MNIEFIVKAIQSVKAGKGTPDPLESGKRTIECPKCGRALTVWISSFNGHTTGKCETDRCLQWIE